MNLKCLAFALRADEIQQSFFAPEFNVLGAAVTAAVIAALVEVDYLSESPSGVMCASVNNFLSSVTFFE